MSDAPEVGPTDITDPQLALATLLNSSVIVGIHPDQVRPDVRQTWSGCSRWQHCFAGR